MSRRPTVVILGLGNTMLTDDGVGVYAAREARTLVAEDEIDVREAEIAGLALLDLLEGYRRAVVIDAVRDTRDAPGDVAVRELERFRPTSHLVAGHEIDLPTAVELGRRLGRPLPDELLVVGIRIEDDRTLSETCTPAVRAAIGPAARLAVELARRA
jgi:hydrogenase maturation protease